MQQQLAAADDTAVAMTAEATTTSTDPVAVAIAAAAVLAVTVRARRLVEDSSRDHTMAAYSRVQLQPNYGTVRLIADSSRDLGVDNDHTA